MEMVKQSQKRRNHDDKDQIEEVQENDSLG